MHFSIYQHFRIFLMKLLYGCSDLGRTSQFIFSEIGIRSQGNDRFYIKLFYGFVSESCDTF